MSKLRSLLEQADLGDREVIEPLRDHARGLLDDLDAPDAVHVLGERALAEGVVDDLRDVAEVAVALGKLGEHVLGPALVALTDFQRGAAEPHWESHVVRLEAVAALRFVVAPGMLDALAAALADVDPEVVEMAIDAALYRGSPTIVPEWIMLVGADDREVPGESRRLADRAYQGIRALVGTGPGDAAYAADTSADELETWWSAHAGSLPDADCLRLGRPIHVPDLFPFLGDEQLRHPVRNELLVITGVGLDDEQAAARWWRDAEERFEAGGLYRAGRRVVSPVL